MFLTLLLVLSPLEPHSCLEYTQNSLCPGNGLPTNHLPWREKHTTICQINLNPSLFYVFIHDTIQIQHTDTSSTPTMGISYSTSSVQIQTNQFRHHFATYTFVVLGKIALGLVLENSLNSLRHGFRKGSRNLLCVDKAASCCSVRFQGCEPLIVQLHPCVLDRGGMVMEACGVH